MKKSKRVLLIAGGLAVTLFSGGLMNEASLAWIAFFTMPLGLGLIVAGAKRSKQGKKAKDVK